MSQTELASPKHFFFSGGSSCAGCGSLLAIKLALDEIYSITKDAIVVGGGCTGASVVAPAGGMTGGLGFIGSQMTGLEMAMRYRGVEKHLVALVGEGQIFDAAFEDLSGVFARRQQATIIAFDNHGFSSAGNHLSSPTPLGARTSMFPRGKSAPEKLVAMMMIFNGARYVATASPAFPEDYRQKVRAALQAKPSFIQVISPCQTNWGYDPAEMIRVAQMAVTSGMFPLWEFRDGVFTRTVKQPKRPPIERYLAYQRRFGAVGDRELEAIRAHVESLNQWVDNMETGFRGDGHVRV